MLDESSIADCSSSMLNEYCSGNLSVAGSVVKACLFVGFVGVDCQSDGPL